MTAEDIIRRTSTQYPQNLGTYTVQPSDDLPEACRSLVFLGHKKMRFLDAVRNPS